MESLAQVGAACFLAALLAALSAMFGNLSRECLVPLFPKHAAAFAIAAHCIRHRSALHSPTQRAAFALAAHCIRPRGALRIWGWHEGESLGGIWAVPCVWLLLGNGPLGDGERGRWLGRPLAHPLIGLSLFARAEGGIRRMGKSGEWEEHLMPLRRAGAWLVTRGLAA